MTNCGVSRDVDRLYFLDSRRTPSPLTNLRSSSASKWQDIRSLFRDCRLVLNYVLLSAVLRNTNFFIQSCRFVFFFEAAPILGGFE